MSHFVQFECKVNNKNALIKALNQMGLVTGSRETITDYYGQKQFVDVSIRKNDQLLPIGFQEKNGELQLVADWYRTGYSEKTFTQQVQQYHDQFVALEMLEAANWYVNSIVKTETGELEIHASQWS